jgi:hypothetical protein|tara:strand:+ start:483 stop:641 length:159 start_codon:yes stop_codon:yes gene_type:complete
MKKENRVHTVPNKNKPAKKLRHSGVGFFKMQQENREQKKRMMFAKREVKKND